MRTVVRSGFLLLVACLVGLAGAPAAAAQTDEDQGDNLVVLIGRAEVRGDETVDNVFVADGPAVVDGRVQNGVIALNGDVRVSGVVEHNIVALNARGRSRIRSAPGRRGVAPPARGRERRALRRRVGTMEPEGLEPGRGQLRPHRHLGRVHRLDPGPGPDTRPARAAGNRRRP